MLELAASSVVIRNELTNRLLTKFNVIDIRYSEHMTMAVQNKRNLFNLS